MTDRVFAAGEVIGAYGLISQSLTDVVARSAIHTAAGGVSGGVNAAITGSDIGMGALAGGISAGIAKGLGGYRKNPIVDCSHHCA